MLAPHPVRSARPGAAALRTAPAVVLLCLTVLLPGAGLAKAWRGVEPGKTTGAEVTTQFGEPARRLAVRNREVLTYFGSKGIRGTNQVQFRINTDTGVVERIDVYPSAVITRRIIEDTYGPACNAPPKKRRAGAKEPIVLDCYVEKVDDGRVYFLYEKLGLAVFFNSDRRRVFSFAYVLPRTPEGTPPDGDRLATGADTGDGDGGEGNATGTEGDAGSGEDGAERVVPEDDAAFIASEAALPEDPLRIGGFFYVRNELGLGEGSPGGVALTDAVVPMLVDVYFDARPNDRLRGTVVGRLTYDPAARGRNPLAPPGQQVNNPDVILDQLWINFDIARRVYLTIGRQRVKWGSSQLWNPTDFLTPPRQNVLLSFDPRIGADLLKVAVPVPELSTNVSAFGILQRPEPGAEPRFGAALRGETLLFGAVEVAASAVFLQQRRPRYGLDVSSPVGPVDLNLEVAIRMDDELPRYRLLDNVAPGTPFYAQVERFDPRGPRLAASGGIRYEHTLSETRNLLFALEGFYNAAGYEDPRILPWLLTTGSYQPFYAGQLYASLLASYNYSEFLDSLSVTGTLLGNLSDQSFVARLDVAVKVVRDMTLELFASVPFGRAGGEFRLSYDLPQLEIAPGEVEDFKIPTPYFQVGIGFQFKT